MSLCDWVRCHEVDMEIECRPPWRAKLDLNLWCKLMCDRTQEIIILGIRALGPLHTRGGSRDHEIVRAQKKVSKGRANTPSKSCNVVTDPQV